MLNFPKTSESPDNFMGYRNGRLVSDGLILHNFVSNLIKPMF